MADNERFRLVAFTEKHKEREVLPEWPQHMTILPWLRGYRLAATNRIARVLQEFRPFDAVIDGEASFGPHGETPVWTIEKSDILGKLHVAVLAAAEKYGTHLEDSTYTGMQYAPYIPRKTGQPNHDIGEALHFSELSVIGEYTTGKRIYQHIPLS